MKAKLKETFNHTLEEKIARSIEYDIIFGRLKPGQRLLEENIAEQLSASRHHVRSALAILETAGIVVRERNKGARVQSYTREQVIKLYDMREMLTRQAILRINLPVSDSDLKNVQAAQDKYEAAVAQGDLPQIHEANDDFHTALFQLCENPYLVEFISRAMDMTYVFRTANISNEKRLFQARTEHRNMISLLSSTDGWSLAELCVAHLRPSREAYLKRLEAS